MKMNALDTALNLSLARSLVVRTVDADLGSFHGLSLSDLALLLELRNAPDGRVRRADLASRLGITTSGVARQLGPLERMGLVDREPHERDARLALVVLTDAGARLADEALPTAEHAAERAFGRLWSLSDQERLGRLLGSVATAA
jgi:DNA-binding MarR family transcriptional regulator